MSTAFVREVVLPSSTDRQPVLDPAACRFPLAIRRSPVHGWGLFAAAPIPANRRIIEYRGQHIDDAEAHRRRMRPLMFMLRLAPGLLIDGAVGGSGAECANHGCCPNMVARRHGQRVYLVSARAIATGDELLWNYGTQGGNAFQCHCGAPACHGRAGSPSDVRRCD